jgi:hypothetical protein
VYDRVASNSNNNGNNNGNDDDGENGDDNNGPEQEVATFADALVWKSITYTTPPTLCGPYAGFWAERPPVGIHGGRP